MTTKQKELIEALRSGKYKQCKNYLRKGDCYCVDGLMCELSGLGTWKTTWGLDGVFKYSSNKSYFNVCSIAPTEVLNMFDTNSLAPFNDRGDTFEQIADMLEKRWGVQSIHSDSAHPV